MKSFGSGFKVQRFKITLNSERGTLNLGTENINESTINVSLGGTHCGYRD